jgi:hypothetical protein
MADEDHIWTLCGLRCRLDIVVVGEVQPVLLYINVC